MVDVSRVTLAVDSSQVKTASRDLGVMDSSAGKLGRTLVALAGGFSALAAIRGTVRTVAQFGQSMAEVSAITRATGEELSQMERVSRQLGSTTEFTASQAASAFKFMGMAGFTAKESIAAIPDVLNLATAAALDLGTAADIASNVMSGFRISADNAGRAADVLAAASSRSNTNVAQLGSAIAFVGPVASAMGIDIGDAAAAIGVLSDAGIQGSAAGTGLRRVLSSLANPTGTAAESLRNLGVNLRDVNPATNQLTDIIDRLSGAGMSAADALTIFGDRGGPAVLALVENNSRVRELAGELSNVEGEAKRMADTMRDTLMMDSKALGSALQELALVIGGTQEASMRSALQGTTSIVRDIGIELQAFTTYTLDSGEAATAASADYMTAGEALRHLLNIVNITAIEFQDLGDWMGYQAARAKMLAERDVAARTFQFRKVKLLNDQIIAMDIDRANRRAAAEGRISNAINAQESASRKLRAELEREQVAVEKVSDALSEVSVVVTRVSKDQAVLESATKQAADSAEKAAEDFKKLREAVTDYVDELEWERAVLNLSERDRAIVIASRRLNATATQEEFVRVAELVGALYDEAEALKASKEASAATQKASEAMTKSFERGIERMRDGIGDFFQRMLLDGKASFSDLTDLFKKMIAEMLATAAANRIMIGVGLSGGSMAASAGSLGGSLLTGGGLLGKAGGLLSSGASALGLQGLASNAYFGMTNAGYGLGGALGLNLTDTGAFGLGSLASAGAGYLGSMGGSMLGESVFGKTGSGIGGSVGAIGGAIVGGPIGAAIGGAIGGFLDSAFGSAGNNRAGVGINTGTGQVEAFGKGGNLKPAQEIGQALQAFSQAIGGSGSMLEIAFGDKSGVQLNGKKFADAASLINAAMDDILDTSWHLAPVVRDLAKAFRGGLDETAAFAVNMQSIWVQAHQNPIRMAMDAMASAGATAMDVYRDQTRAISDLARGFDGSLGAAQNLNLALAENQNLAFQLAGAFRQVGEQAILAGAASAQQIRESVMTAEELMRSLGDQRKAARDSIGALDDPAAIAKAVQEAIRLNERMFQLISDPTRDQAEQFATRAEEIAAQGERRTEKMLSDLEKINQDQNREIRDIMRDAAASQQQAANTMLKAANIIAGAASDFGRSSEVAV